MLTTTAVIEDYLGVTLTADELALYTLIIAAVDAYIEGVCDCEFDDATYNELVSVDCGMIRTRNQAQFVFGFRHGVEQVIQITPPAGASISIERLKTGGMTVRLISAALVATSIDASSMTFTTLVAAINAVAPWVAAVMDADNASRRALFLLEDMVQEDGETYIYLDGCVTPASTLRKTVRTFIAGIDSGVGVIIYKGGFATVPSDLQDAATRMVIKAYADRDPSSTVSGDLKGEEIGDYKYSKFTANEISTSIGELSVPYQSVIDKYKNFSI